MVAIDRLSCFFMSIWCITVIVELMRLSYNLLDFRSVKYGIIA